jgi:hypothetical protein
VVPFVLEPFWEIQSYKVLSFRADEIIIDSFLFSKSIVLPVSSQIYPRYDIYLDVFADFSSSPDNPYGSFDINLINTSGKEIYFLYLDIYNVPGDVTSTKI